MIGVRLADVGAVQDAVDADPDPFRHRNVTLRQHAPGPRGLRLGQPQTLGLSADVVDQFDQRFVTERPPVLIFEQRRQLGEMGQRRQLASPFRQRFRHAMVTATAVRIGRSLTMAALRALVHPPGKGEFAQRRLHSEDPLTATVHRPSTTSRRRRLLGESLQGWLQRDPPQPLCPGTNPFFDLVGRTRRVIDFHSSHFPPVARRRKLQHGMPSLGPRSSQPRNGLHSPIRVSLIPVSYTHLTLPTSDLV